MAYEGLPRRFGDRPDIRARRGLAARHLDRTRGKRLASRRRIDVLGFGFFAILGLGLMFALGVLGAAGIGSVVMATTVNLPPVSDLSSQFSFKTTQILDRNGKLLYEVNDKDGGRRLPIPLAQVSPVLIDATIATEDKDFYSNVGIDPVGIARAVFQNTVSGQLSQGASTITQQLAKNRLIAAEQRTDKSWTRKVQEAVLAYRISQTYSKDEILELYFNSAYYGHQSYGIEAAAQTYFGKHASDLSLSEASMLAGLPQAPSEYDPFIHLGAAKDRQAHVLDRMTAEAYITPEDAQKALSTPLDLQTDTTEPFRAPHFVMYVRQLLEQKYGAALVYNGGLKVTTTLDLNKYDLAMNAIRNNLDALRKQEANNAGLVSMDPKTGQILVMVGSKDYFDNSIAGEVNMATSPRPPGSTIKPLEYSLAFSKGWGPETIITDEATQFPNTQPYLPPYAPHNFDFKFDGQMTIRYALSNSKNIPAIKALMYDGIPDFVKYLASLGITINNADVYGLTLGLGAHPISVLNMAAAYCALDNGGIYHKPVAILKVEDWQGNVLEQYQPTTGEQVLGAVQAYEITSILADNWSRTPLQGPNSPLKLTRPAAAKTGSTDDYKDSWTIGYTPDFVTAVWVGNTDNKPMKEVLGSLGAGRIWHSYMEDVHVGLPVHEFTPPPGVREYRLCKETGQPVTDQCKSDVLQEVWPLTYTQAPFAVIPGLGGTDGAQNAATRKLPDKPLGRTVSPDGIALQPQAKDKPW